MLPSVAEASLARVERLVGDEVDRRIDLLLSNVHLATSDPRYARVTADPRKMAYLRPLLKHFAKSQHPFTDCVKGVMKHYGPGRSERICAVLKDILRQGVNWRGHPERDHGSPGAGIAEADKGARMSLLDELDAQIGVVDHSEGVVAAFEAIDLLGRECDVYRVLLGLDDPPNLALAA